MNRDIWVLTFSLASSSCTGMLDSLHVFYLAVCIPFAVVPHTAITCATTRCLYVSSLVGVCQNTSTNPNKHFYRDFAFLR